jgi:hypothetical protein
VPPNLLQRREESADHLSHLRILLPILVLILLLRASGLILHDRYVGDARR